MTVNDDFRVRPGRIRDRGARPRSFVAQVLRAAIKAGYVAGGGGTPGRPRRGRGRGAAVAAGLRSPTRRVVVKARIVRHAGRAWRAAPLMTHIAYLQREGVDREGARGAMFDARGLVDERAFAARCEGDRHHFRFIVSPEDAEQMGDLQGFAKGLMRRAEMDLGTGLDWVAVDHWNTAHPHVHVLVRGRDEAGQDLVIDPEYISRGLRARAEDLVSLELGPRTPREIAAGLERQTCSERWTPLDRMLVREVRDGRLDLRPGGPGADAEVRSLLAGRAAMLERLGLAAGEGSGVWRIDPDLKPRLDRLAERADIIATLHRAFRGERALSELSPYAEDAAAPIVGRVVARGLHDELLGRAYLVVDGVDGRAHHVRLPDLEASGDTPAGGMVEVRPGRLGPQVVHRSDLSIEAQVAAKGSTWLDRQLMAREPLALSDTGYGGEVRAALAARTRWLSDRGLGGPGPQPAPPYDLLARLRAEELAAAGARLAHETGLRFEGGAVGEVRGRYARRVDLASGRFAMIESGLGFRLVPWARLLDRRLGEAVSGQATARGVDWDLGRRPGLSR